MIASSCVRAVTVLYFNTLWRIEGRGSIDHYRERILIEFATMCAFGGESSEMGVKRWHWIQFLESASEGYRMIYHFGRGITQNIINHLLRRLKRQQSSDEREYQNPHHDHHLQVLSEQTNNDWISGSESPQTAGRLFCHRDHQPATLSFAFKTLSQLCATIGLWVPSFILEVRNGLQVSRNFVLFAYLMSLVSLFCGIYAIRFVTEPAMAFVLPNLNKNVFKLMSSLVILCELGYVAFGMFNMAYICYHRAFIQEFALFHGSIVALPRSFQQQRMVSMFVLAVCFCASAEPLFAAQTIYIDVTQPLFWPHLSRYQFLFAKASLAILILFLSIANSALSMVIPLLSNYLIVACTEHLKIVLKKQLARLHRINVKPQAQSDELVALLDNHYRRLMAEYSCDTLTMDWPPLAAQPANNMNNQNTCNESFRHICCKRLRTGSRCSQHSCRSSLSTSVPNSASASTSGCSESSHNSKKQTAPLLKRKRGNSSPTRDSARTSSRQQHLTVSNSQLVAVVGSESGTEAHTMATISHIAQANYNKGCLNGSSAGSLLFLYKNLVKTLSELKGMIETYEHKFGSLDAISICLRGFIVAQWVVLMITQERLSRRLTENPSISGPDQTITTGYSPASALQKKGDARLAAKLIALVTAFAFRTGLGVVAFIVSNVACFLRSDCLPDFMVKMRSQLFRMNIDLALEASEERKSRANLAGPLDNHTSSSLFQSSPSNSSSYSLGNQDSNRLMMLQKQHQQQQHEHNAAINRSDWLELDQVWSLYDQVDRMSRRVNFKLTPSVHYNKRCLLKIFGREISLILLYVQIIDIYSYA